MTSGAAAGMTSATDSCAAFRFAPERWEAALREDGRESENGELLAEGLVRCGTLEGRTRDEVRALLGSPHRKDPKRLGVGRRGTSDVLGPGDEATLTVDFGLDERAGSAGMNHPDWS